MVILFNFNRYKYHYYNNNLQSHRLGAPSCESIIGTKRWYKNGMRHRDDGAAIEFSEKHKWFYFNDILFLSEKDYWITTRFFVFI